MLLLGPARAGAFDERPREGSINWNQFRQKEIHKMYLAPVPDNHKGHPSSYPTPLPPDVEHVPHNIEAEQALLGAILLDNRAFERVQEVLRGDHFFDPLHEQIFEEAAALIQAGRLASPVTLKPAFDRAPPISEFLTVPQYLGQLVSKATTVTYAKDYALTIAELSNRRSLIVIGEDLARRAIEAGADAASVEIVEEAEGKLFELAEQGTQKGGTVSFGDAAKKVVTQANNARRLGFSGLATGLLDLTKKLGGLRRSDLIILAGRPSMGKTALATNIAWNVARKGMTDETSGEMRPAPVGFFSLEMSDEQLANRLIAAEVGVSSSLISSGHTTEEQIRKIYNASNELAKVPLYIDDRGGISIGQLMARARRMKRQHGIELLIVDYLQLLSGTKKERVQELTQITTGLKALAKELNIPVIALSQLSRANEKREDKRPQLSDLRESGSIEQDADIVMFVYREEYYLEREKPAEELKEKFSEWQKSMQRAAGKAEVIIGKQRHGPIGIVEMAFDGDLTKFSDLARGVSP